MDVRHVTVAELTRLCQAETQKYLRQERSTDVFCFELFRRAIAEQDNPAWEAIINTYRPLVLTWGRRHPARAAADVDDDWMYDVFGRFWRALPPERFPLFNSLASLLKFLKLCVHSSLTDAARAQVASREVALETLAEQGAFDDDTSPTAEDLWQIVRHELKDESEYVILYLSFAMDMKPSEIQQRYPEQYATVDDVYRIKRNVLDRLRRSRELSSFLL